MKTCKQYTLPGCTDTDRSLNLTVYSIEGLQALKETDNLMRLGAEREDRAGKMICIEDKKTQASGF